MIDLNSKNTGKGENKHAQMKDYLSLKLPQVNRPGIQINERGTIDPPNRLAKPLDKTLYEGEDYIDLSNYLEHL